MVEREGISFSHPARFILVGTMNPEEGDLRPQLLDRFALCVDIQGIHAPEARVNILQRTVQFERDPDGFHADWEPQEGDISQDIASARKLLDDVTYNQPELYSIARLTSEMQVDGHRADIVILKAAIAHAAFNRRTNVTEEDILVAAELALPHRLKRHPFQDTEVQFQELAERLDQIRQDADEQSSEMEQATGDAPSNPEEKKTKVTR